MANSVTLSAYSIKVHPKGSPEKELQLTDFSNGENLYTFLTKYLTNLKEDPEEKNDLIKDDDIKKVLKVSNESFSSSGNTFTGIVEKGEYGYKSKIFDVETGKKRMTKKQQNLN